MDTRNRFKWFALIIILIICMIGMLLKIACRLPPETSVTFDAASCTATKTEATRIKQEQIGCSAYGLNPDNSINLAWCVQPQYRDYAERAYNIKCGKSEWRRD